MCLPIRCHSCNTIISWLPLYLDVIAIQKIENEQQQSKEYRNLFAKYELNNYCCRMTILTYVCFFEKLKKKKPRNYNTKS